MQEQAMEELWRRSIMPLTAEQINELLANEATNTPSIEEETKGT
jgi:hypothetical protein